MTMHRTKTIVGLSLALLTATACAANEDEPTVADSEQALDEAPPTNDVAPDADQPGRHAHRGRHGRHRRGPDGLLWSALEKLELTDTQRTTIEGLARDLHQRPAPSPEMEAKRTALAEAVRSGHVDVQALTANADDAPMKAMHAKVVTAIDELHATLTPEQRNELVTILKERRAARADEWAEKKARRGDRKGDRRGNRRGGKRFRSPSRMLLHGIDVSDAQLTQIETALSDAGLDQPPSREGKKERFAEMKAQRDAMLAAFPRDDFDASRELPPPPERMADHHERFVKSLAVIVPLLDESQRTALADRLEEGPKHLRGKRGPRAPRR